MSPYIGKEQNPRTKPQLPAAFHEMTGIQTAL